MANMSPEAKQIYNGGAKAALANHGIELLPEQLGKGAFSVALAGTFCGDRVAVKISLNCLDPSTHDSLTKEFDRGAEIWPFTREHPNITTMLWHGLIPIGDSSTEHLCTIWECAEETFASHQIANHGQIIGMIRSVGSALAYLHRRGTVHRDVKPANILVFKDRTGRRVARLSDLGLARVGTAATGETQGVGTPEYCHIRQFYGESRPCFDVYSLAFVYLDAVYRMHHTGNRLDIRAARRSADQTKKVIKDLINDQTLADLLVRLLVEDDFSITVETLVSAIVKSAEGETVDYVDDNQFFEFGPSTTSVPLATLSEDQLGTVQLSRDCLLEISAMAIGTETYTLPESIRQNIDIVGVFRAKELASEAMLLATQIKEQCKIIRQAVEETERQDNYSNLLTQPLRVLSGIRATIGLRAEREGQHWEPYLTLITSVGSPLEIALNDFAKAKRNGWPERFLSDQQKTDRELLASKTTDEEQLKFFRQINALLFRELTGAQERDRDGNVRPSPESQTGQFFQAMCELLDGINAS